MWRAQRVFAHGIPAEAIHNSYLLLKFTTQVAEGYATAFSLIEFLQKKLPRSFRMDLKFPILFGVAQVLKGERRHVYLDI